MSLARALTTRVRKTDDASAAPAAYIGRAASQRAPNAKPIKRSDISLPVALLSTTNMLSYEAPNIVNAPYATNNTVVNNNSNNGISNHDAGKTFFSSEGSVTSSNPESGDESEHTGSLRSYETDATSVDLNSPDLSDNSHSYFKSSDLYRPTRSASSARASQLTTHSYGSRPSMDSNSPRIPSRAPSHNKKAHMLSHKRSVTRMASNPTPAANRDSIDMFNAAAANNYTPPASHPFGKELEQLNEAAEEFGHAVRDAEAEADVNIMRAKNLARVCVSEYLDEVSQLYATTFEEDASTYQPMIWI